MANEKEIQKMNEMLKGYEYMALSEYLNSLKSNKNNE